MEIFGWEIAKKVNPGQTNPDQLPPERGASFVPKENTDDGALVVSQAGQYGQYIDTEGTAKNDSELITRYRTMSDHPTCSVAINSIVNEAIINEPENDTITIDLDDIKNIGEATKKKIVEEFANVLQLYNFDFHGYEIFKRWYVDGRLYYHAVIDMKKPKDGILELRYVDPRKIRAVKEIENKKVPGSTTGTDLITTKNEFFIFSEKGFGKDDLSTIPNQGIPNGALKIAKDAVIHITSGQMDAMGKSVVSYLHKAIRPLNQVTMLEDAMIIYRLARAPERRVFYVDGSGMAPQKSEQYLKSVMNNFKNKIVYDSSTGEVRDNRKFMTMFEDFWLVRRNGTDGTKVETLPGAQNLGEITDIEYMLKKLYSSLEVPYSRLNTEDNYSLGRATEISRDEITFEKFITRLRARFSMLFINTLRLQLILKNIVTAKDWELIKNQINFIYAKDNLFAELKNNEVMSGRAELLSQLQPFIGSYYSNEWIRRNVCQQTDEDIQEINSQINKELSVPQYNLAPPEEDQGVPPPPSS